MTDTQNKHADKNDPIADPKQQERHAPGRSDDRGQKDQSPDRTRDPEIDHGDTETDIDPVSTPQKERPTTAV